MPTGVIGSLAWSTDSERLAVVLSPASLRAHGLEGQPERLPALLAGRQQQDGHAAEQSCSSVPQLATEQPQPSADGQAAQATQPQGHHQVQVWQRSNWKWYCKAEHWYDGAAAVVAQWDPAHPMRLAATTAEGLHRQVRRGLVLLVPQGGD